MKRTLAILIFGALLGISGYAALYRVRVARAQAALEHTTPELAWLKSEFNLSDAEFARIQALHEQYLPQCARMCAKIAAVNTELEKLVLATNKVTPEISERLAEIGRLRQECQTQMLAHFYAVSQAMPKEQGRRYLERMQKLTSLSNMRDHSVSDHRAAHGNSAPAAPEEPRPDHHSHGH
jgi:small-conductance mechanosensitive channel